MSISLCRWADVPAKTLEALERALTEFYSRPPREYYEFADHSAGSYTAENLPFHYDMVQRIRTEMSVLELGCGTAHLCPYVEQRGGTYTGVDHSEDLLQRNRLRYPNARFLKVDGCIDSKFDVVASLYVIEHVVNPVAYLEKMWSFCKPGGLLAMICPEFVDCAGLPPSVFYGTTARKLRHKFRSGSWQDAIQHVLDWKVRARSWKKKILASESGSYWMNLLPSALNGAKFTPDTDAVHLVGLRDLLWFLDRKGARIIQDSKQMCGIRPDVSNFNCYVFAQRC